MGVLLGFPAWGTSCGILPPCAAVKPGLTVVLAEATETRLAVSGDDENHRLHPIRMKLRTLVYGKSPGDEFVWHGWESQDVHAGDLFYLEAAAGNFLAQVCGVSGPFSERFHRDRISFFRQLASGEPQHASFRLRVDDALTGPLNGATAILATAAERFQARPDGKGSLFWPELKPGTYRLTAERQHYTLQEETKLPETITLLAGACGQEFVRMRANFHLQGIVRTPDGAPARDVPLQLVPGSITGRSDAEGRFRIQHVPPGEYILRAGGREYEPSPYPASFYPGVPNPELAATIRVDPGGREQNLQFTVPAPMPARTIQLMVPRPANTPADHFRPRLTSKGDSLYSQSWSEPDSTITALVRADVPFEGSVVSITYQPIRIQVSKPISLPPGTATLTLPVAIE